MKPGIRVLGIDDSPFSRGDAEALVVGVVCRKCSCKEGLIVEGVLSTKVFVDGDDGTEKAIALASGRFAPQIRAVLLNGIMLAGFNAVDISELSRRTGLPAIALTRKKPDGAAVGNAVQNAPNWGQKQKRISAAGPPKRICGWYAQLAGTDLKEAGDIIAAFGNGPIRLAHLMASGIVKGESGGRA
jgi:endonuclease V-like protein UPF0215 family